MLIMYQIVKKFNRLFEKISVTVTMALMVLMTLMVAYQVVMRTVLSMPTSWTETASLDALTWAVFLMAPSIYRRKELLNLDFIYTHFPAKVQSALTLCFHILEFAVICILMYYAVKFTQSGKMSFSLTVPTLTMNYIYVVIPIAFGGMILVCVEWFLGFCTGQNKITAEEEKEI